jgi:hypothetical protein
MRSVGVVLAAGAFLVVGTGSALGGGAWPRAQPRVMTDGHLRPGHLETIRVSDFPGKGEFNVSFGPTAICEAGCGARSFRGGRTDAQGDGRVRVRMPGTFLNSRNRPQFFRDRERISVEVTWEGPHRDEFAATSAEPEPELVRVHGHGHA